MSLAVRAATEYLDPQFEVNKYTKTLLEIAKSANLGSQIHFFKQAVDNPITGELIGKFQEEQKRQEEIVWKK